jgi:hypothetical protein
VFIAGTVERRTFPAQEVFSTEPSASRLTDMPLFTDGASGEELNRYSTSYAELFLTTPEGVTKFFAVGCRQHCSES